MEARDWNVNPDAGTNGIRPITTADVKLEYPDLDVLSVSGVPAIEVLADLDAEAARLDGD